MEINYVGSPGNTKLPFFAYGIFKPGQLAYPKIMNYVEGEPSAEIVDYEMLYRDGIPLIRSEENENLKTSGYLMKFKGPEAYEIIGGSQSDKLFMWDKINVNGTLAYALVGVDPDCGSSSNQYDSVSYYNYRQDSFFKEALELIRDTKKEFEESDVVNMKDFFKIQMHYMLLWSVIERFCNLTYGYAFIGKNIFNFANEWSFRDKLRLITRKDVVYSSDTLNDKYLDSNNHIDSIFYYYTIRCNVVHKGKTVPKEERNKLKNSLGELYCLFMAVYNGKLEVNNELLNKYGERGINLN